MHELLMENVMSHFVESSANNSKVYFIKWDDKDNGISEITLKGKYSQTDIYCAFFGFLKNPLLPHWGFFIQQLTLFSKWRELPRHADKKFPNYTDVDDFDCYAK